MIKFLSLNCSSFSYWDQIQTPQLQHPAVTGNHAILLLHKINRTLFLKVDVIFCLTVPLKDCLRNSLLTLKPHLDFQANCVSRPLRSSGSSDRIGWLVGFLESSFLLPVFACADIPLLYVFKLSQGSLVSCPLFIIALAFSAHLWFS